MGTVSFGVDKNILELEVMVAKFGECIKKSLKHIFRKHALCGI